MPETTLLMINLLERELDKINVSYSVDELKIHASLCFGLNKMFFSTEIYRDKVKNWVGKILKSQVIYNKYKSESVLEFYKNFNQSL